MNFLWVRTAKEQLALGGSQEVGSGSKSLATAHHQIVAGVLESLSALAHAHLELGVASPFLVSAINQPLLRVILTLASLTLTSIATGSTRLVHTHIHRFHRFALHFEALARTSQTMGRLRH